MSESDRLSKAKDEAPVYMPALEALYYLVGRRLLDGAHRVDLSAQLGVEPDVVEEGWRVTLEQLSLDIALRDHVPNRLLSLEELRAEGAHCVRRLIEWREKLLTHCVMEKSKASASDEA